MSNYLLDFSFTTTSGANGSFTLNTDTPVSNEPANFGIDIQGISYNNAVSNFSLSSQELNVSNSTADWQIASSLTSSALGLPPSLGVLSGVSYKSGCSTTSQFTCLANVAVLYSGDLTKPALSPDPNSYSTGLGVDFFDPVTFKSLGIQNFVKYKVIAQTPIPESNSSLGILAIAVGLWFKRNADIKKA